MAFFSFARCFDLQKGPFSSLGESKGPNPCVGHPSHSPRPPGLGAVRTATKRAGGTVRNHGGSPGQRLGIKKFAGALQTRVPWPQHSFSSRASRHPGQYHRPAAWHLVSSRSACAFCAAQRAITLLTLVAIAGEDGQGPHTIRHCSRLCAIL